MTQLSETATALCVLLVFLVPLAAAGLSLVNAGLGRSRSAAHSMLSSLAILAVAVLVYFFCGFAWQGFAAGPALFLWRAFIMLACSHEKNCCAFARGGRPGTSLPCPSLPSHEE